MYIVKFGLKGFERRVETWKTLQRSPGINRYRGKRTNRAEKEKKKFQPPENNAIEKGCRSAPPPEQYVAVVRWSGFSRLVSISIFKHGFGHQNGTVWPTARCCFFVISPLRPSWIIEIVSLSSPRGHDTHTRHSGQKTQFFTPKLFKWT